MKGPEKTAMEEDAGGRRLNLDGFLLPNKCAF